MTVSNERLKIAVFIDFDNIEIGVKNSLGGHFDVGAVLEGIKERGEVVTKVAYGDWTRATDYGRSMSQHAIHMVQRNLTPGGDKNGADINLALDALEMAFTHNHINAFVIVGGDSDFITLVEKLKQYDRKVFVVGGRSFTSHVMQKNCTEFMAYEDIVGMTGRSRHAGGRPRTLTDIAAAMPLIRRAIKLLADKEMAPQLGLLKSTLLQLDSSFSEKAYGAGSFRDFVEKLAKAGLVSLRGADRSFYVELRESGEPAAAPAEPRAQREPRRGREGSGGGDRREAPAGILPEAAGEPAEPAPATVPEAPAEEGAPRIGPIEGFQVIVQAFSRSEPTPRFPMYVRHVKQFLKSFDESFDERRYGFAGMLDALRFGQREGLFRLERDRQGGVRVHPGPQFQTLTQSVPPAAALEPPADDESPRDDRPPADLLDAVSIPGATLLEELLPEAQQAPLPFEADAAPAAWEAEPAAAADRPVEEPPQEAAEPPVEAPPAPRAPARRRAPARAGTPRAKKAPAAAGTKKAAAPADEAKKKPARPRAKKA